MMSFGRQLTEHSEWRLSYPTQPACSANLVGSRTTAVQVHQDAQPAQFLLRIASAHDASSCSDVGVGARVAEVTAQPVNGWALSPSLTSRSGLSVSANCCAYCGLARRIQPTAKMSAYRWRHSRVVARFGAAK